MKHHRFGVKEAIVSLVTDDNPASITGVVNGTWFPFRGLQACGYQLSPQTEKLIVEGLLAAQESTIDSIPVTLEYGQFTPDIDALIAAVDAWYRADGSMVTAMTENFGNCRFSLKCRTDRVGINGMESIIEYPKLQISGLDRSGQQRAFAPNKYTVAGFFPDALYPTYKDGLPQLRRVPVFEYLVPAGSPLYTVDSAAPTGVSVNADASGDVAVSAGVVSLLVLFSKVMNLNSVNDLTMTLTKVADSSLVPCTCVPVTTGGDAYKSFTLATVGSLVAGSYTLAASTVCRSRDGVQLTAAYTRTITVS